MSELRKLLARCKECLSAHAGKSNKKTGDEMKKERYAFHRRRASTAKLAKLFAHCQEICHTNVTAFGRENVFCSCFGRAPSGGRF